jgi:hypothetical protein
MAAAFVAVLLLAIWTLARHILFTFLLSELLHTVLDAPPGCIAWECRILPGTDARTKWLLACRLRRMWRMAEYFKGWTPQTPLRQTYRFWDEYEVELVARWVVRFIDDYAPRQLPLIKVLCWAG